MQITFNGLTPHIQGARWAVRSPIYIYRPGRPPEKAVSNSTAGNNQPGGHHVPCKNRNSLEQGDTEVQTRTKYHQMASISHLVSQFFLLSQMGRPSGASDRKY